MGNNLTGILIISFFKFYYLLISVSFYAYIPVFFASRGFGDDAAGALFALQSLMAILTYLPSGFINDKISAKRQIVIATFVYSLFLLLLNFSSTYLHFTALFILWGVSATMIDNSTNVIYYKESQVVKNRFFFSFFAITATMAYAAGGKLGATLSGGADGFGFLFKALFAMSLALIAMSFFLSDTRAASVRLSDYKDDILSFDSLLIAANLFLFTYHWGAELTYFTLFFNRNAGLGLDGVSWIYLEVGLVMSAIIFTLGAFKHRIGLAPRAALMIAVAFSAGSQLSMRGTYGLSGALFNQFLHSIGDACFVYYWLNIIPATFKYEKIGGASSFVNLFTVLSVVSGSYISSMAVRSSGDAYSAFLISGGLMLLIYPLALFERLKKKKSDPGLINLMEATAK